MSKRSVLLGAATAVATIVTLTSTAFAGFTIVDARTCVKVKDLKDPAAITYTINPVDVTAYSMGAANSCTLGKISQVCLGSTVGADIPNDASSSLCCFKPKCDAQFIPNGAGYTLNDQNTGAGDFTGSVTFKTKASMVCVQCSVLLN